MLNKLAPQIPELLSDPNDPNKYQRNLMKLEIFYKEFNFERIYEKPSYTVSITIVTNSKLKQIMGLLAAS